jgi:hypothetical protein
MSLKDKYYIIKKCKTILTPVEYCLSGFHRFEKNLESLNELLEKSKELLLLFDLDNKNIDNTFLNLIYNTSIKRVNTKELSLPTNSFCCSRQELSIYQKGYIATYEIYQNAFKNEKDSYSFIVRSLFSIYSPLRLNKFISEPEIKLLSVYNILCYHINMYCKLKISYYYEFLACISFILNEVTVMTKNEFIQQKKISKKECSAELNGSAFYFPSERQELI